MCESGDNVINNVGSQMIGEEEAESYFIQELNDDTLYGGVGRYQEVYLV